MQYERQNLFSVAFAPKGLRDCDPKGPISILGIVTIDRTIPNKLSRGLLQCNNPIK